MNIQNFKILWPLSLLFLLLFSTFTLFKEKNKFTIFKIISVFLVFSFLYFLFNSSYSDIQNGTCIICYGKTQLKTVYFGDCLISETQTEVKDSDPIFIQYEKTKHSHIFAFEDCHYRSSIFGPIGVFCYMKTIDYPSNSMALVYNCALKQFKIALKENPNSEFEKVYYDSIKELMKNSDDDLKKIKEKLKEKLK